jgi:hypothetical protein
MASFDLGSITAYKFGLLANVAANTNANSIAIDTQGFEAVALVSSVGASTLNVATNLTVSTVFFEGNDTNISNATAVAAGSIVSNPRLETSNTAYWASLRPTKRYLFARYVPTTNATANIASVGALGFAHNAPTQ